MTLTHGLSAAELTKFFRLTKGFDKVLRKVNILSLGDGNCTAELKLEEEHGNVLGGLHGGLSATIVDGISSYAFTTHKFGGVPHVSIHLNLEYLKGAQVGDEIQIFANTVRAGKTLAFLEVFIKDKKSGSLLVKGTHTKFLIQPKE